MRDEISLSCLLSPSVATTDKRKRYYSSLSIGYIAEYNTRYQRAGGGRLFSFFDASWVCSRFHACVRIDTHVSKKSVAEDTANETPSF